MKAEELKEKAENSSAVAFHKFVLLQREHHQDLFCFYEGYDNGYYFPRIKTNYNGNHHPIKCGNKKSVLHLYDRLKVKYSDVKTAFFVDNDFDDRINNPDIYETPCYSIENFYTSENCLSDILKNEFELTEKDEEYLKAIQLFKENQRKFHDDVLLFNAWYATVKEESKNKGTIPNVSLNCALPKGFILIEIGNITKNYDFNTIQTIFPEALKVTEEDVIKKSKELKKKDLNKVLRGKYEFEFMYLFLFFLIEDANKDSNRNIFSKKTKFRIDKALMLSQISQYAETPVCLIDYINKFN